MTRAELAPAKVNLTLHVTGQRADGYHLLDSLVVFTEMGDVIALSGQPGLQLRGPEASALAAEGDNLVLRAARMMGQGAEGLVLTKRLPVASGIGGGSSDAAATLRLLARVHGQPLPPPDGVLGLGADVPVCLPAQPARMRGIGDLLSDVPPLPEFWLVLANPRRLVPTGPVFRLLARKDNPPMTLPPAWPGLEAFVQWLAHQRNDLEPPACQCLPMLPDLLAALRALPACRLARMSGSGATCFGLFATRAQAEAAAALLARAQPHWWVAATAVLPPAPVLAFAHGLGESPA
jgi:4-diphosphocytidyl-2-C-methyl-D-erythritol kinase